MELTRTELNNKIKNLVDDYNALCAKALLKHRLSYNIVSEKLVLANREQLAYGSYQCELAVGAEKTIEIIEASIKIICFEHGE